MQTNVEKGDSKVVDVVGLGYTATDYLSIVPRLPEPDTKLEALCLSIQGGGPVATGLVTVRRLGLSASYVGKVGDDDFGNFMLRELEREGIDVSRVVCEKGATSQFAFIMVDETSATRTIVWTRGSVNKLKKGEADLDLVDACKCLLLDDLEVEAAIEAAKRARLANVPIVLDAGSLRDGMRELVGLCDFVVASKEFGRQFSGEAGPLAAAQRIYDETGRVSVVTAGAEGAVCVCANGVWRQEGFRVRAVDTTGAGDVFHGAFAAGIIKGWEIPKVLEFSCAVAAMKCRSLGGRPGIPSFVEAIAFLRRESTERWWGSEGAPTTEDVP
ncbi:MAG: PfkB family carbohydrate kinase [Candidatus Eisenbacteria bacterium]|nr:PfkB family carbohydrate kinase [Candidatus Eisenbacteria bacterium]